MIDVERDGTVAVLRLNHGKVNALDVEMLDAVAATVRDAAGGSDAIVLIGAGRAFSAGIDLRPVLEGGEDYITQLIPAIGNLAMSVFDAPVPVVSAVNGPAIAGGCVLAAACDRRLIAAGATTGATEVAVGVPFPFAALEVLRHACGRDVEGVVLGAAVYSAEEAVEVGLADRIVAGDDLLHGAVEEARRLADIPPETFRIARRQLRGHVVDRVREQGPAFDRDVVAAWSSPRVTVAIESQMARLARR